MLLKAKIKSLSKIRNLPDKPSIYFSKKFLNTISLQKLTLKERNCFYKNRFFSYSNGTTQFLHSEKQRVFSKKLPQSKFNINETRNQSHSLVSPVQKMAINSKNTFIKMMNNDIKNNQTENPIFFVRDIKTTEKIQKTVFSQVQHSQKFAKKQASHFSTGKKSSEMNLNEQNPTLQFRPISSLSLKPSSTPVITQNKKQSPKISSSNFHSSPFLTKNNNNTLFSKPKILKITTTPTFFQNSFQNNLKFLNLKNRNTFSLKTNNNNFIFKNNFCTQIYNENEIKNNSENQEKQEWIEPVGFTTGVMVINSLCPKKKVPLKTDIKQRKLNWYTCGPTVYASTHLGHARVFVSIDIMQRILKKCYGIHINHMMNITDVDDKILNSAREKNVHPQELSIKYEEEFWKDMERLNIEKPQVITRVTDYIPQIVEFIQTILDNGYGYVSNGSVYFDLEQYGHAGKLLKDISNQTFEVQDENLQKEKKNPQDFVLWKATNTKNLSVLQWPSPWGWGRPGWHIECSTMIHSIFGNKLDVHAGGIDLKFPHHENEISQCGAYFNDPDHQWVNYFLHIGHLHIEGLKMSKSLKNFITLQQMLDLNYTVNQFRIFCVMSRFHHTSEYTIDRMNDARDLEEKFEQFFMNSFNRLHALRHEPRICRWRAPETDLFQAFSQAQSLVTKSLSDYFDCPSALAHLANLIKYTNHYFKLMDDNEGKLDAHLVEGVAGWIAEILTQWFGLDPGGSPYLRLFSSSLKGPNPPSFNSVDIVPVLDTLVDFRSQVKEVALTENSKIDLLQISDKLRDEILPPLGIRLEDQKDKSSHWKIIDVRTQQSQKEEHFRKKLEWQELERKRKERAKIPPEDYFKTLFSDRYSKFTPEGIPLLDQNGDPLSKSAVKKLKKELEKQKKLYANYLKTSVNENESEN